MSSPWSQPGQFHEVLQVGDLEREFIVYRPRSWAERGPVVLAFHGAGSCAEEMIPFCGMNRTADEHGFAVVYPNGTGHTKAARSWNTGADHVYAAKHKIDDCRFVACLLDHLADRLLHDRMRVFATGMSNGGLLCYLLARVMPDRFSGMAPVAVSMVKRDVDPRLTDGLSPMPILHIHGTDDHFVPYEGGPGRQSLTRINFAAVEETVRFWATVNQCDPVAEKTDLTVKTDDGTFVTEHRYRGGLAPVTLYQVHGGGHTWPGEPCSYAFLGTVSGNLIASKTIWHFFQSVSAPN